MIFTYLCLYRCRRITLKGYDKIEIHPTSKTQLILGTNGAGKSSLFRIGFSVTPSQKNDFFKGGYKIVKVAHEGHHYELAFNHEENGSAKHSFIRDGIELNMGFTASVQRELVREHFRMTQELHDLLVGSIKFTSMSPLERRNVITKMSETSFEFVLDLYKKLQKSHTYAKNVSKHNTERLTEETGKLLSPDDMDQLNRRSVQLRDELTALFRETRQRSPQVNSLEAEIRTRTEALDKRFKRLMKVDLTPPMGYHFTGLEQLKQAIAFDDQKANEERATIAALGEELQYLENQMEQLKAIEGYDEAYIRKRIQELDAEADDALTYITAGVALNKIDRGQRAMDALIEFMSLINLVSAEEDRRYTDRKVQEARSQFQTYQSQLNGAIQKLGNIQGRLQHIDRCQEVGCPQCGFVFKQGVQQGEDENLQANLLKGETIKQSLEKKLAEQQGFLSEVEDYHQRLNTLNRFRQQHPELGGFWTLVDKSGGLTGGADLMPTCQLYRKDMIRAEQIDKIDQELAPLKETLNTIEKVAGTGSGVRERYYDLKARIEDRYTSLAGFQAESELLGQYLNKHNLFEADCKAYVAEQTQLIQQLDELMEEIRQDELVNVIRRHQGSLAIVENGLTEAEVQHGIVNDLQKDLNQMSQQEQAFKVLLDVLSPKDGLIAEQISVFLNAMIDRMNAAIARVWGYTLALLNCNLAEDDLDYRFPMYAVKPENAVADVNQGSESQMVIVNDAFRRIQYKFQRLHGYPLYIDEIEATFDPVHRINLIPVIKTLIEDDTYGQVFIISHYIATQGSFQDAEIVVLDDAHLSADLNRSYNQHVTFG